MPYLFSYGTLQQVSVQASTFGRLLEGSADNLIGFIVAELKILDVAVIAKFTGLRQNRVPGTVFEVSEEELNQADRYEVDSYRRILATLESGKSAWVYVEAAVT